MAIDPDVQVLLDDINARLDGVSGGLPSGSSLQDAYDGLPDSGGVLKLEQYGRYDVGGGLRLDRRKRVVFTSDGRGSRGRSQPSEQSAPVVFSSTGAATLVSFPNPPASANAYGFEWSNVDFEISPTTTIVFDAVSVNMMIVENCGVYHPTSDTVEAPFLFINAHHNSPTGDDSSWFRIRDNYVVGGTLVRAVGHNVNQWVISENNCIPQNSTDPMIYLWGAHRCVIRDNNLEGTTTGIYLEASVGCRLDGNGGEDTDPFVHLHDSYANLVTDLGISAPGAKKFALITGTSSENLIISAVGTGAADLYNTAGWITDSSTNGDNWIIAPSSTDVPERIKLSGIRRGAGPPEGAVAADVGALYMRSDGGAGTCLYVKETGAGNTGWVAK